MQTCSYLPLKDVMGHVRAKLRKCGMTMADVHRKTREMDHEMNAVPLLDDPDVERDDDDDSVP